MAVSVYEHIFHCMRSVKFFEDPKSNEEKSNEEKSNEEKK